MCSGCAVMMSATSPSEKPHISKISHYNEYQLDALYDCSFRKQIDTNILIKEYNWETGHPLSIKYCRVAGHAVLDFFHVLYLGNNRYTNGISIYRNI